MTMHACRIKLKIQGSKGPLTCSAEVLTVVAGINMVEFQRSSGDHADFYQLYRLLAKAVQPAGPAKGQDSLAVGGQNQVPGTSGGVQEVQQRLDALTTGQAQASKDGHTALS